MEGVFPIGREIIADLGLEKKIRSHESALNFRADARSRARTLEDRPAGMPEVKYGHEAMFGVQLRDPTGDQRVVECCLSIPEDQFLRNGTNRWLARRAVAGRVPAEILAVRTRGVQAADWLDRLRAARKRSRRRTGPSG